MSPHAGRRGYQKLMQVTKIIKYIGGTPTARLLKNVPKGNKDLKVFGIYKRIRICSFGNLTLYSYWRISDYTDFYIWNVIETEEDEFIAGFGTINKAKEFLKRFI